VKDSAARWRACWPAIRFGGRVLVALLAASPLVLPVASGTTASATAPERDLTFAIDGDQITMDPQAEISATQAIIQLNMYDALVRFRPGTTTIVPSLATAWRVSGDGLTWTFTLRKGVKFHDGSPFNPQAVKFSIDRMKALNKGMAFVLKNVANVQPQGDDTVTIKLGKPDAIFFQGLPSAFIVSPTSFGPHMNEANAARWAYDHVSGTGPYMLRAWERGRRLEMAQFNNYWGGWDPRHAPNLVQLVVEDFNTRRLMLERGDIDFMLRLEDQPDAARALRQKPGIIVKSYPTLSITYIVMANHKGPLKDVRVRRALSYAVDHNAIQFLAYGFQAKQARGPLNSSIPYHDTTLLQYKRDVAKAKQLLAEAGFPNGGFRLQFGYVGTVDAQRRIVEIVQQNLAELGITVVPLPATYPALVGLFTDRERAPDLMNLNNHSPYADPDFTFSQYFASAAAGPGGSNAAWYSNAEVDRLIDEGRSSVSPAKRKEIYTRLQRIIVDDAPMIWNAELIFLMASRDNIKGFEYLPAFARSPGYLNHIYLSK
jgi:peptide/nickel transport system substrate-binding protein